MDHLLNDVSPDDAADEIPIKNETGHAGKAFVVASQTLPGLATPLATSLVGPDSSAASLGLHMLSVSAAAPSVMMSTPKLPPRLPPISLLTAAAAALQPMQSRQLQTRALPSPPQPQRSCSLMAPLQAAAHASPTRSLSSAAAPQARDHLQADDDLLCRYRNKKCGYPRAIKRNGERHNLCERHRAKANQNQRKLESKRRIKKRMMQRTADRVMTAKKAIVSSEREVNFTLYGVTLA